MPEARAKLAKGRVELGEDGEVGAIVYPIVLHIFAGLYSGSYG